MKPIAVLFALPHEAGPFLSRLRFRPSSLSCGSPYDVVVGDVSAAVWVSGMGAGRSSSAAKQIVKSGVGAIVIAGFGGALCERLATGDIIAGSVVDVTHSDNIHYECNRDLVRLALSIGGRVDEGLCATVSSPLACMTDKLTLGAEVGASIVDMESAPAAAVARDHGIPFLVVRAVVDRCQDELRSDMAEVMDADGGIRRAVLVRNLLRRPSLLVDAIRLGCQSRLAACSLRDFLIEFLPKAHDIL